MRRSKLAVMVAAMAFSMVVTGCSPGEPPPRPKVVLAYIPFTSCAQLFVAIEKGYFAEEGLDVEARACSNSNIALNALISGEVHGSIGNGFTTLLPIEESDPGSLRIYHPCLETRTRYTSNIVVRPSAPFQSIADLKGHRIGTYTGATQLHNLHLVLAKFMDPTKDIQIIQVATPLQIQCLVANQFDALFTIEPTSSIALDQGAARLLEANVRVKYILDPFPAAANSFRAEFVREQPLTAAKIVRALDRAILYIREHETEARQTFTKYLALEPPIAAKCGLYEWWRIAECDVRAIQRLADLMHKMDELKKPIDVEPLFIRSSDVRLPQP